MKATGSQLLPAKVAPTLLARIVGVDTPLKARRALWGYLFLLPWLVGLMAFVAGPILASFYFSFTEYSIWSPPKPIGLANYSKAFLGDRLFWPSLGRTFTFALVVVPMGLVGSLLLALLLNQGLRGTNIFRTLFFLPHLTPTVAMAVLFAWLLHPQVGPVNLVLGKAGLPQPGWLADRAWALPTIILMSLWANLGGNRMLIFLAGLQGVPQEMHEAAEIDGAGSWHRFRYITLPMISPTMFFNLVLGVIAALKVFAIAFVATKGGPGYATWFYALHIYNQAFAYFRMGYGSALAWIFALILMSLTYLQIRLSERWVYYGGA